MKMIELKRNSTTAKRLQEALDASGLKQVDLSRKTGINKGTIHNYLHGRYEPKSGAINKLAIALNVSEAWLWGYDVPKERSEKKNNPTLEGGGLSDNRKKLMRFVEEVPEDKVELLWRVMRSILEGD
jgi:transcriptional regulator with XRE-family HTH domain